MGKYKKSYVCQIELPFSKSIAARQIIISLLTDGRYIEEISIEQQCDDVAALLRVARSMREHLFATSLCDTSTDDAVPLYVHQSGTAMRLVAAVASYLPGHWLLTGDRQVMQRPMRPLIEALRNLGADISCVGGVEGYLPLEIRGGKLSLPHPTIIDARSGWPSSQYVSALCLIAPLLSAPLTILRSSDAPSTPYIEVTLEVMRIAGIKAIWQGDAITIEPGQYLPINTFAERDWSAAACWYQYMALRRPKGAIQLTGLRRASLQGDRRACELFALLGVVSSETSSGMHITATEVQSNEPIALDLSSTPDLFPTFAVSAVLLGRELHLRGLAALRDKESNRLVAVAQGLASLGYHCRVGDDTFDYYPSPPHSVQPGVIATHDDHRIAMAFGIALASLPSFASWQLDTPSCVAKSYPLFWQNLQSVTRD